MQDNQKHFMRVLQKVRLFLVCVLASCITACGGGDIDYGHNSEARISTLIDGDVWTLPMGGTGPVWHHVGALVWRNTSSAIATVRISAHANRLLSTGRLAASVNAVSLVTYDIGAGEAQSLGLFSIPQGLKAWESVAWSDEFEGIVSVPPGGTINVRLTCIMAAESFGIGSTMITDGRILLVVMDG